MGVIFLVLFSLLAAGVLAGGAMFAMLLNEASEQIPTLDAKMASIRVGPTRIMSSDGKLLYESATEYRIPTEIAEVPDLVQKATLAAEDKRFYEHDGVDPWAVARQVFTNVREQRVAGGASTLTMQLAKRLYTSPEQSFKRKLEDAALALQIERKLTKSQILELYLNQVFYGSGAYGITAAADVYFGKSLDELTASEAAMLSRCVRRPSSENPFVNYEKAIENRNAVLAVMFEEKMISKAEYDEALADRPKLAEDENRLQATIKRAPYFVRYILDQARLELGVDVAQGGYTIETSLDSRLQKFAEDRARRLVDSYRRSGVTTNAFMLMNRSGEILCMIGGVDYAKNKYNAVTQGKRQPGSAMKPLVYGAAFEQGVLTPSDPIRADTYRERDGGHTWTVEGRKGGSSVPVSSAIQFSMNPPAVRAMKMVNPKVFVEGYARRVYGLTTSMIAVPSLVLGSVAVRPIELAQAYSIFQHEGSRVKPYGMRRILDSSGNVVRTFDPQVTRSLMSSASAEDMDYCLRKVVQGGTGSYASSVRRARGKTGTTNDNRDAWFIGYTDNYLAVSWVANEQFDREHRVWVYKPMSNYVMGGKVPILMWRDVMKECQDLFGEPEVKPDPLDREKEREAYVTDDGEGSARLTHEMGGLSKEKEEDAKGEPGDKPAVSSVDAPPNETPKPETGGTKPPVEEPPATLPDGNPELPDGPGDG